MAAVALITDLFFVSKVKGTADAVGVPLRIVRNPAQLAEALEAGVRLAIIDMNAGGVDVTDAIRQCKAAAQPPTVLAYLSHVQRELHDAAQEAGADLVMPRSKFSEQLPDLLKTYGG